MPAKHTIKEFVRDSVYHLYNRGVEKQPIFRDAQDFGVFLSYLKDYLVPKDEAGLQQILTNPESPWREKDRALKLLRLNNFSDTIDLLCYCLMPNHFHLLVKQAEATTIDRFMNSLCTRYTMYFNKKYKRVGPLFQSVYKAVLVQTDAQLFYLTRYIHRNPLGNGRYKTLASQGIALRSWNYGSYPEYLGKRQTGWVKPQEILQNFSTSGFTSYVSFVDGKDTEESSVEEIAQLMID